MINLVYKMYFVLLPGIYKEKRQCYCKLYNIHTQLSYFQLVIDMYK